MFLQDARDSRHNPFNEGLFPALEWDAEAWVSLFDQLASPTLVYHADGRLILANLEARTLLGLEGREGQELPDYLYPLVKGGARLELYDRGREVTVSGASGEGLHAFALKRLALGGPGGLILATGLVPEMVPRAPTLQRGGAFAESVELAGEVSQKVIGPLAGIELCASIVGEELGGNGESELLALIDEIRYSAREVNECLTSFESMTRPLKLDLKPERLSAVLDGALESLNGIFKAKGIGVLVEQKDLVIEMDRGLMGQLFINVLLNAAEAMPGGGRLIVRVEINRRGEAEIIFTDSGPGVNFQDSRKVFNPFYTTKKQTLGLGLPVSQRIAEAHQGSVAVGQDETMGARVKVTLPYIPGEIGNLTSLN
ncbi:MAG: hypothetical protein LBO66_11490 [Deltaproteobacteria bacterium]|jgi:signal transduction histidine kinase|nr:hypothetical protein [Deltaproteobacteria bacterium]